MLPRFGAPRSREFLSRGIISRSKYFFQSSRHAEEAREREPSGKTICTCISYLSLFSYFPMKRKGGESLLPDDSFDTAAPVKTYRDIEMVIETVEGSYDIISTRAKRFCRRNGEAKRAFPSLPAAPGRIPRQAHLASGTLDVRYSRNFD